MSNVKVNDDVVLSVVPLPSGKLAEGAANKALVLQQLSTLGTYLDRKSVSAEAAGEFIDEAEGQCEELSPDAQSRIEAFKFGVQSGINPDVYGFMPCSFQALLYEAMSKITDVNLEQMEAFVKYMIQQALTYGGLSQNPDGSLTILTNSDGTPTGGLIGKQVQLGYDSADQAKQAADHEAVGLIVSGVASFAAVGGSAIAAFKTRNGPLDEEQQINTRFSQKLNNTAKADTKLAAGLDKQQETLTTKQTALQKDMVDNGPTMSRAQFQAKQQELRQVKGNLTKVNEKIDQRNAIQNKIKEIAGDREAANQFIKDVDNPNSPNKEFNDQVMQHLKASESDLKSVREHNQTLSDGFERQKQRNNDKYSNTVRNLELGSNTTSQAAQGATKMQSAEDQQASAKEKADEEAVKTLNQGIYAGIQDAKQKADSHAQDAFQIAQQYAQMKI